MNRNNETFSQAPTLRMGRSKIPLRQNIKTTFNTGYIVPFFINLDIMPGDTIKCSYSAVVRQTTALTPTMDNAYVDFYFFATPWRLTWQSTKQFFGENPSGAWANTTEKLIPQYHTTSNNANQIQKGHLADYMGLPIKTGDMYFSKLPFRAYTLIYNEYFRDQNLTAPVQFQINDNDSTYNMGDETLILRKACKFHDYFTSCLPAPQKGTAQTISLGTTAPIKENGPLTVGSQDLTASFTLRRDQDPQDTTYNHILANGSPNATVNPLYYQSGLYADLSNAVAATINAQRYSFATQRILERDARAGTRYREYLKSAFGVNNGDARMQIPEYLGGERVPLSLLQVAQTSATSGNKALGDLAAYGHTATGKLAFTKSFTEHNIILGLMVIRTDQSYDRGMHRMWSRRRRYDVYDPALAYLGEQAVLQKEIFCTGSKTTDDAVFGYQERWAEMRYLPNLITGAFRTNYATTLDIWHYGNAFNSAPVLSTQFLEETVDNIDRTLVVPSATEDQFLADIEVNLECYRVMPTHSIPGLIDHF